MSFTGDLEHLPIVDVIQLLHATRKSGILRVACRKGESQLVFKEGYIVSANHLNGSIRIGSVLVERNIITADILDRELREQKNAGAARRPLIIALLEKGLVNEEDAYRGLEQLIEITVVEILTWKKGTFTLDVMPETAADDYRYYPGRLNLEVSVDAQGALMEALRIYDEKIRDGVLTDDERPEDDGPAAVLPAGIDTPLLSADDLGLADIDTLETKIPGVFTGLEDRDPAIVNRRVLAECAPDLAPEQRDELVSFLNRFPVGPDDAEDMPRDQSPPLLFFTHDELFRHAVTTVCRHAGMLVFATDEEQNLGLIMARSLTLNVPPVLVLDFPDVDVDAISGKRWAARLRQLRKKYSLVSTIQLAPPGDAVFMLDAYDDGVRAVIPRPSRTTGPATFSADVIRFFRTFQTCMQGLAADQKRSPLKQLAAGLTGLRELREPPDVAHAILRFAAGLFGRALTLVVRGPELVADKGVGIVTGTGMPAPSGFRIPLAQPSLFRNTVETGRIYYGPAPDAAVREHLFAVIGAPRSLSILMLPLRFRGKTIALIYGDFGDAEAAPVQLDLLEIMTSQAEVLLENVAFRKKLEKPPVSG